MAASLIPKSSEPEARYWHVSQCIGGKIYIWGGLTLSRGATRARDLTTINEFDTNTRSWCKKETKGTPHPGFSQAASASFGKLLYLYGGNDGEEMCDVLSELDLATMMWSRLSPENESKEGPLRKDASGMVHFKHPSDGKHKLVVACGYACLDRDRGSSDENSEFKPHEKNMFGDYGWTNEIHSFDTVNGQNAWSIPIVKGARPKPCGDVTFTSIDEQRAFFYEGRGGMDLYFVKFISESLEIEKCISCPQNRLGQHAATYFGFKTDKPQLWTCGGRLSDGLLEDVWRFDLDKTWKKETISDFDNIGRWGHTITAVAHSDVLIELIMFGGSPHRYPNSWDDFDTIPRLSHPVSFIYGFLIKEWVMLGTAPTSDKSAEMLLTKGSHGKWLKGVEVCGKTQIEVTNNAQSFEWKRYGLKINIKQNSLPKDTKQVTIHIMASIAGHYECPDDYQRVSPVFWFVCDPLCKLEKEVTLEIQHCAMPEHPSDLIFARAVCFQEKLPYTFELLKGGQFSSQRPFGILELNGFSGIAAFFKNLVWRMFRRRYFACLYYPISLDSSSQQIHLVVTWNTPTHVTVMKDKYPEHQAKQGPYKVFHFESDRITLNIPQEGTQGSLEGWEIIPLNAPVVMKNEVDEFRRGIEVPCCQLMVNQTTKEPKPLRYTIILSGANAPVNFFNIVIKPEQGGVTGVPVTRLSEHDHSDIYSKLKLHATKWREIGMALGFFEGELDNIQSNPLLMTEAPESWLKNLLTQWLQWAPGDGRGSPSFATRDSLHAALLAINLGGPAQDFL